MKYDGVFATYVSWFEKSNQLQTELSRMRNEGN